jgi:uncharacterized protein
LRELLRLPALAPLQGVCCGFPAELWLVPLVAGAVVHWSGVVSIELPEWLLAAAYALIGWKIGLGFTREVLRYASRALPKILLSIAVLIVFCGGLAFVLMRVFGVDPLTAYLATSPGGIDSVAIIAALERGRSPVCDGAPDDSLVHRDSDRTDVCGRRCPKDEYCKTESC